jgi:hypothetical protein
MVLLISPESVAADRVEIEVATEPGLPPTAPQRWAQLLGKLNFSRVRLRGIRPGDAPDLVASETPSGHSYRLLAVLDQREQLLLPGAAFTRSDLQQLRQYLERLREEGLENFAAKRGRFGLTVGRLQTVLEDLTQTVRLSTIGQSTQDILAQLDQQLQLPLVIEPAAQTILARGRLAEVELQGMTAGTSLALLLRAQGLALTPQKLRGQPLQLSVAPLLSDRPSWPVGWKSSTAPRRLLPDLYKRLPIEIDGYSLTEALKALQPRIGVPLRWDRWILGRQQIVPEHVQVTLPRTKTYLKRAVDRLLSQARLANEMRVDEGGNAFFWITQFGQESPRAEQLAP